jgi:hypothetical protein
VQAVDFRAGQNFGDAHGTSIPRIVRILSCRCSPRLPSSVYDRSNAFGPRIFISQRSFAWEPMIETRQSPRLSASACSTLATTSPFKLGSPVFSISTMTVIAHFLSTFILAGVKKLRFTSLAYRSMI